ncbi:MAG TPA: PIN domain-containing protein [Candidatus Saccharimonadales bacterium]|jgi:uncharacterized protein YacL|nr:PIN domain-containing protein [Candidatus Saccharimonadales bacterium]
MEPSIIILSGLTTINIAISGVILTKLYQRARPTGSSSHQKAIIDTCALIDGRILDVVRGGFVPGKLLIPQAVIAELQYMADQSDPQKRERARFGLDIVRELQALPGDLVTILPTPNRTEAVDDLLVTLATQHGAVLFTTDYNLNKVADIKGVRVLNVNELAQGLRARFIPGETALIRIVQKGQDSSQGVGHLDDGTMVVVERAGGKVGQTVTVIFSRVLQTQAGRMLFAKLMSTSTDKKPKDLARTPPAAKVAYKDEAIVQSVPTQTIPNPQPQPHKKPNSQKPRRNFTKNRRTTPEDTLMDTLNKY